MRTREAEAKAKMICHYYETVAKRNRSAVYKHFTAAGTSKATICRILNRYEEKGSIEYSWKGGRKPSVSTHRNVKRLEKLLEKAPDMSMRTAAGKMDVSKSAVQRMKADKLGMKTYVAQKVPKYVKDQAKR